MFDFQIDEQSMQFIQNNLSEAMEDSVRFSLDRVWQKWGAELERQRRSGGDGGWAPLSQNYAKRKDKEYPKRGLLDRTGFMMRGYLNGISIDYDNFSVQIPYPTGTYDTGRDVTVVAKSHQDEIGQPNGVVPRPFDTEKFEEIAFDEIRKGLAEGIENANKKWMYPKRRRSRK